jgi:hypothetical protein
MERVLPRDDVSFEADTLAVLEVHTQFWATSLSTDSGLPSSA